MAAICRNTGWRAVNDGASKATAPSITARPTPQEKRLFAAVAARRQVSESTLALIAIRALLDSQSPEVLPKPSSSGPALDRITIRLRPGDRLAIRHRAAERRMKDGSRSASSWASGLWDGWRAKCETGWRLELKPAVVTSVAQIEVVNWSTAGSSTGADGGCREGHRSQPLRRGQRSRRRQREIGAKGRVVMSRKR